MNITLSPQVSHSLTTPSINQGSPAGITNRVDQPIRNSLVPLQLLRVQQNNSQTLNTTNMQTARIIQKFYTKAQANSHASYLRAKAKEANELVAKIEVVNAYNLYTTNNWFKKCPYKLGTPTVDTYMVIVHHTANFIAPLETSTIKKEIKRAVAKNKVRSTFFIVRLNLKQINEIKMSKLTPSSSLSNTIGIQYKHLTRCSTGKNKMRLAIFPLDMRYSLVA